MGVEDGPTWIVAAAAVILGLFLAVVLLARRRP